MPPASTNPPHPDLPSLSRITRRGFLAVAGGTLASCAGNRVPEAATGSHIDPRTKRVIPHNPDIRVSPEFPIERQDITHTRALVSGKFVAMTFDDGPHPQNTPRLLGILRERNIKATFYVIGRSVEAHPGVLRQTVAEGHEIGNHTMTHRLLTKLDDGSLRWELESCHRAIQNACPCEVRTMRPPYGGLHQRQRQLAFHYYRYPTILWSVDPQDWKRPGPSVVASRIIQNTRPGAIILAHDLHAPTVSAMPAALDELLYQGYQFVTVSQLLSLQGPTPGQPAPAGPVANS